ncbi:hypothetical protein QYM36_008458, partial [Artemia franciscana]
MVCQISITLIEMQNFALKPSCAFKVCRLNITFLDEDNEARHEVLSQVFAVADLTIVD